MCGARLVLARPRRHADLRYVRDLIRAREISVLHFVPSLLQPFLELPGVEGCHTLRLVMCGGEPLSPSLKASFHRRLSASILHLYGPTEAAIAVTGWLCDHGASVSASIPIGRPMANSQLYILDPHREPVPIGVSGELYIGGVPVARGYLNRADLTAASFIPDPFQPGPHRRLYKTGDLARYRPDGAIELLGRADRQVKIQGVRIEPLEVETTIAANPAVRAVAVVPCSDDKGQKRLVAFIVAKGDSCDLSVPAMRAFVAARLPSAMVPAAFVLLDSLPLLSNGKVDHAALAQYRLKSATGVGPSSAEDVSPEGQPPTRP
jgi:acyl-CoA synthetase (AMP-forming)/AMP-acid ligase II